MSDKGMDKDIESTSSTKNDEKKKEDELDPRIKEELDALNNASENINKLENEVQRARASFKMQKSDCTNQLLQCSKNIGKKYISKAKEYYDLYNQLSKIQQEVKKSTQKFQKANGVYKFALETVGLAEVQVVGEDGGKVAFNSAWQDMLNNANLKFMEAEKEKRDCELEHQRWSREYEVIKQKLNLMHRENAKAISKSKQFYDLKKKFEGKLKAEKQNAEDLQFALTFSKHKYKTALNNLERISEELHMNRKLPMRTPGVGAESDVGSELSDHINFNLDLLSETSSQVSRDDLSDFDSDLNFVDDLSSDHSSSFFDSPSSQTSNPLQYSENFLTKMTNRFNRSNSLGTFSDKTLSSANSRVPLPLDSREGLMEGTEKHGDSNQSSNVDSSLSLSSSYSSSSTLSTQDSKTYKSSTFFSFASSSNFQGNPNSHQQSVGNTEPSPCLQIDVQTSSFSNPFQISKVSSSFYYKTPPPLPPFPKHLQQQQQKPKVDQQKPQPSGHKSKNESSMGRSQEVSTKDQFNSMNQKNTFSSEAPLETERLEKLQQQQQKQLGQLTTDQISNNHHENFQRKSQPLKPEQQNQQQLHEPFQPPQTPQTRQTLQPLQTPQPSQTPQPPQTPQTLQPPQTPQLPQTHQTPQPPQTTQPPQTPQTPQPPQTPQTLQLTHQNTKQPKTFTSKQQKNPQDGSLFISNQSKTTKSDLKNIDSNNNNINFYSKTTTSYNNNNNINCQQVAITTSHNNNTFPSYYKNLNYINKNNKDSTTNTTNITTTTTTTTFTTTLNNNNNNNNKIRINKLKIKSNDDIFI